MYPDAIIEFESLSIDSDFNKEITEAANLSDLLEKFSIDNNLLGSTALDDINNDNLDDYVDRFEFSIESSPMFGGRSQFIFFKG